MSTPITYDDGQGGFIFRDADGKETRIMPPDRAAELRDTVAWLKKGFNHAPWLDYQKIAEEFPQYTEIQRQSD